MRLDACAGEPVGRGRACSAPARAASAAVGTPRGCLMAELL